MPGERAPGPDGSLLLDIEALQAMRAPEDPELSASWHGEAAVQAGGRITVTGQASGRWASRDAGIVTIERKRETRPKGGHPGGEWEPVATAEPDAAGAWSARIQAVGVPSAQRYRAVWTSERRRIASVRLPTLDVYRLNTYEVATRGRVQTSAADFAAAVASVYGDGRGWQRAHQRFRQVRHGGDFTLVLAQAQTLRTFSPVCSVQYSCRVGRYVVINEIPWLTATPAFTAGLRDYRRMVINHETGHWLGLGHSSCARPGDPAPVMMQQSKGLKRCAPNAWPLAAEVAYVEAGTARQHPRPRDVNRAGAFAR